MRHTLRNIAFALVLVIGLEVVSTPAFAVATGGAPRPTGPSAVELVVNTILALLS